ncbi:MAG: alpha/beta fold hydrolase [Gammaproteobacteria bacterium]
MVGEGPPLVILHGLFGSGRNWATLSRKLGEHFRVWSVDLRNHGDSPHSGEMGYPAMAADLLALFERERFGQIPIIGHSMGGKVAMWFALNHPDRVAKLLVVDIAPVAYAHEYESLIDAMQRVDLARVKRRDEVDAQLREAVPEVGVRQFLLTNLVSREGRFRWRINLPAIAENLPSIIGFPHVAEGGSFRGPTLFLGGERSPYIRPEHHSAIRALFPAAKIRMLPDTGHWVHAERPGEFLQIAQSFLSE